MQNKQLSTKEESAASRTGGHPSRRPDPAREIIRNDLCPYMQAQMRGAVEVPWERFELRHVRLYPTVQSYTICFEIECILINGNPTLRKNWQIRD